MTDAQEEAPCADADGAAGTLDEPEDMARIRTMALAALGLDGSPRPTILLVQDLAQQCLGRAPSDCPQCAEFRALAATDATVIDGLQAEIERLRMSKATPVDDGFSAGVEAERSMVVAWLRAHPSLDTRLRNAIAASVEAGDHNNERRLEGATPMAVAKTVDVEIAAPPEQQREVAARVAKAMAPDPELDVLRAAAERLRASRKQAAVADNASPARICTECGASSLDVAMLGDRCYSPEACAARLRLRPHPGPKGWPRGPLVASIDDDDIETNASLCPTCKVSMGEHIVRVGQHGAVCPVTDTPSVDHRDGDGLALPRPGVRAGYPFRCDLGEPGCVVKHAALNACVSCGAPYGHAVPGGPCPTAPSSGVDVGSYVEVLYGHWIGQRGFVTARVPGAHAFEVMLGTERRAYAPSELAVVKPGDPQVAPVAPVAQVASVDEIEAAKLLEYLAGDLRGGKFVTGMQAVLKYAAKVRAACGTDRVGYTHDELLTWGAAQRKAAVARAESQGFHEGTRAASAELLRLQDECERLRTERDAWKDICEAGPERAARSFALLVGFYRDDERRDIVAWLQYQADLFKRQEDYQAAADYQDAAMQVARGAKMIGPGAAELSARAADEASKAGGTNR